MRAVVRVAAHIVFAGSFQVEGAERVPRRGGLLVCSNHASNLDPPLLPAILPRPDSWSMAKSEWFERPDFTNWLFTRYHAFPVVRHSADRRALKRAIDILLGGHVLILYPEGTRVEAGGLLRAEPGAGFLARTTGVVVQPAGLVGTRDSFPKGARLPRHAAVAVRFGSPFRIRSRGPDGGRIENQAAADSIMLAVADLLPEEMRGAYAAVGDSRPALEKLRQYV